MGYRASKPISGNIVPVTLQYLGSPSFFSIIVDFKFIAIVLRPPPPRFIHEVFIVRATDCLISFP